MHLRKLTGSGEEWMDGQRCVSKTTTADVRRRRWGCEGLQSCEGEKTCSRKYEYSALVVVGNVCGKVGNGGQSQDVGSCDWSFADGEHTA
ncbi:MAG: hypothetical protein ACKERG_00065 [Candidatus Hodgkinia cicadicola]